jgi:mannose-6-phosphate isomerase
MREERRVVTALSLDLVGSTAISIANTRTAEPLIFIEVQRGDYFGEDDILRLDDDFGRADDERAE